MSFDGNDTAFMRTALSLAKRMLGTTAPNPSVGCVIVKNGHVIARGVTQKGGSPHAEINALAQISAQQQENSTIYITLEPCCFEGSSGACTKALVKAKPARVVIGCEDPNPKVAGKGIKILKSSGISVESGLLEEEARFINRGFFHNQNVGRPWLTLKLASTIDGRIATQEKQSKWITNAKSRQFAHYLRAKNEAILVGIGTIMADNPALTCRIPGLELASPIRVVLDSNLQIPTDCLLLQDIKTNPVWIIISSPLSSDRAKTLQKLGVKLIECPQDGASGVDLKKAMQILAQEGINRILCEGGAKVATSLLQANLVDEIESISAPSLMGDDGLAMIGGLSINDVAAMQKFRTLNTQQFGDDVRRQLIKLNRT